MRKLIFKAQAKNIIAVFAKFNALGNPMFDTLAEQLDFPFRRNGAYVLACSPSL